MERPSDKLIQDVLDNKAQADVVVQVTQWFVTNEGNRYLQNIIDEDIEKLKSGRFISWKSLQLEERKIYDRIEKRFRKNKFNKYMLRVAAILIPLVLMMFIAFKMNQQVDLFTDATYNELITPKGERQIFIFQDGTKVYINADSKLNYPDKFGLTSRNIDFEGEAYFVVANNKKRPFVINVGGLNIKVLGTSFNIRAYPNDESIVVQLDDGTISLFSAKENHDVLLSSGYDAVYDKTSGSIAVLETKFPDIRTAWKNNIISFRNTSLTEVLETLERWYNISFEVIDSGAYSYSYTLTVENTSIEKLLSDLEKIAPIKFILKDEKVIVYLNE